MRGGSVRSSNKAEDGSVIPVTVCIKRVRLWFPVSPVEATNPFLGPQLDNLLSPWWDALSSWVEVATGQDLANLGDRRPKQPQTFHLWGGNADGTMRPLAMLFHATDLPPRSSSDLAWATGVFGRCCGGTGRPTGTASFERRSLASQ